MEAFHIPSHSVPATNTVDGEINRGIIRDDPINVAVLGDHLEEFHEKGHFLEFHEDTVLQTLRRPVNVLEMNITFLLRDTYQTVRFQSGIENKALAMSIL